MWHFEYSILNFYSDMMMFVHCQHIINYIYTENKKHTFTCN